jgi:hypothetical protein
MLNMASLDRLDAGVWLSPCRRLTMRKSRATRVFVVSVAFKFFVWAEVLPIAGNRRSRIYHQICMSKPK